MSAEAVPEEALLLIVFPSSRFEDGGRYEKIE